MIWLRNSIKYPVVVLVGVIFVFLFGGIALKKLPYQLTPQVHYPVVSIYTSWKNASPYEIEAEILKRQEKALKSLESLQMITSIAREGRGSVTLTFQQGSDLNALLLKVSQKLGEVRGYPNAMDRPIIKASGESIPPSIYLFLHSTNANQSVEDQRVFFTESVVPFLERVSGVGEVSEWENCVKSICWWKDRLPVPVTNSLWPENGCSEATTLTLTLKALLEAETQVFFLPRVSLVTL